MGQTVSLHRFMNCKTWFRPKPVSKLFPPRVLSPLPPFIPSRTRRIPSILTPSNPVCTAGEFIGERRGKFANQSCIEMFPRPVPVPSIASLFLVPPRNLLLRFLHRLSNWRMFDERIEFMDGWTYFRRVGRMWWKFDQVRIDEEGVLWVVSSISNTRSKDILSLTDTWWIYWKFWND